MQLEGRGNSAQVVLLRLELRKEPKTSDYKDLQQNV